MLVVGRFRSWERIFFSVFAVCGRLGGAGYQSNLRDARRVDQGFFGQKHISWSWMPTEFVFFYIFRLMYWESKA